MDKLKTCLGTVIIFLALRLFFYQFNLFPWGDEWAWWYMPHLVTAGYISLLIGKYGHKLGDL